MSVAPRSSSVRSLRSRSSRRCGPRPAVSCRSSCARSCTGTIWWWFRKRPSVHRQRQVRPASIEPGTRRRVPSSEQGRSDLASGPPGGSREVYLMKTQTRFWILGSLASLVVVTGCKMESQTSGMPAPPSSSPPSSPSSPSSSPSSPSSSGGSPGSSQPSQSGEQGSQGQTQESPFPEQEQQQSGSSGGSTSSPSSPSEGESQSSEQPSGGSPSQGSSDG